MSIKRPEGGWNITRLPVHPGEMLREEFMKPLGISITSQFHRLEDSVNKLAKRRPADGSMSSPNGAESGLEGRIFEGFDRLNANIGTAFSAYSGVLKLAVSALEKAEGATDDRVAHPPGIASPDTNRATA